MLKIEIINEDSPHLEDVKSLGKKNSSTLGHMPIGGFDDYASKRGILGALNNGALLGYLMFREVRRHRRVTIVHLCIDSTKREKGIASTLLKHLIQKYKDSQFNSIELHCREDYSYAIKLWRKSGFSAIHSGRSKSKEEHSLIRWRYSLRQVPSIFSPENYPEALVKVLLDTNIIVKLRDGIISEPDNPLVLLADSIIANSQYFVSDEMYNEIFRDSDYTRSKETMNYIQSFQKISPNSSRIIEISNELKSIISGDRVNDESDRRHIATCIECNIPYILTFDIPLINKSDKIEKKYGIKIMHPTQFIIEIDSLQNKESYNPTLLQGSAVNLISKIEPNQINDVCQMFWQQSSGEDNYKFKSIIHEVINNLNGNIKLIRNENNVIGIIGIIKKSLTLEIPILRVRHTKQGKYLYMYLISDLIRMSINEDVNRICISDTYISPDWACILSQMGFVKSNNVWDKYIIKKIIKRQDIWNFINNVRIDSIDSLSNYEIEKLFFPLKLQDADIPSYIIPIRSSWAQVLFDNIEASTSLFGVDTQKLWNIENVYYRSVRPDIEKPFARILWYVSYDKNFTRNKSIVATSYLDDVQIGTAKHLFDKFKHYGVYNWSHIMDLTNNMPFEKIKSIIFSNTEVFKRVIPLRIIRNILKKNITFQSPLKISSEEYFKIYERRNGEI